PHFSKVRRFSPEASRNSSSEVYLICRNHTPWGTPAEPLSERYEASLGKRLNGENIDVEPINTRFKVHRRG
ncbi:MAG TPA: hypothetical protein D7I09_01810, partial [Candidatus Poseidoniales archaeon]